MTQPIIAFIKDSQSSQTLSQAFAKYGTRPYVIYPGGIVEAIAHFRESPSPSLLLVDCSESEIPLSHMKELLQVCNPGTPIIALGETLGDKNDIGLFREFMRLQIKDYLIKPLLPQLVIKSLEDADPLHLTSSHPLGQSLEKSSGKVIAFTGTRGGVGTTTLALNVADALANERGRKVALLDMDSYFGALNIYLDLPTNQGIRDLFVNPERIDMTLLERVMATFGERLKILSAPLRLEQVNKENGNKELDVDSVFQQILSLLSIHYHYVIIDLPKISLKRFSAMQEMISLQCLVNDLSIVGLRDTLRMQEFLGENQGSSNTLVILNKNHQVARSQFQSKEFEESLGHPVDYKFSYEPHALECANVGVPLRYKSRTFSNEISELVEGITGGGSSFSKPSPLKTFFNLKRFLS